MSQIFLDNGVIQPVTLIRTEDDLSADLVNKSVKITGISKGKGFTGVMQRWGFAGVGEQTRGQSTKQRAPGSIGSQTPGRVYKGKKMAGRHGNRRVTIKGLKIVQVNEPLKQLMVSGPVPGSRNSELLLVL